MWSKPFGRVVPRHLVALLLAVLVAGAGIVHSHPAAIPPEAASVAVVATAAIRPPPANQTAPPAIASAPPLASGSSPSLLLPSPPSVRSIVASSTQAAASSSTNAAALIAAGPELASGLDDISDATLVQRYGSTLLSTQHLPSLSGCDADAQRLCDAHLEAVRTYSYSVHSASPPNMTVIELLQLANQLRYPGLDEFCAALPQHVPPTSKMGVLTAGAAACRLACRQPGEFGGLTAHPICRRTWVVFGVCATRAKYPEALSAMQLAKETALKRVVELLSKPLPAIAGTVTPADISDAALDTEYGSSLLSVDLWQPLAGCKANATRRLCAAHYAAVRAYRAHRPPPPNMEVIQLLQEAIVSSYAGVQAFCAAMSPALPLHKDCSIVCADGAATQPMCHRILAIYQATADNATSSMAQAMLIAIQRITGQTVLPKMAPATPAVVVEPAAAPVVAAALPAKGPADVQVAAKPAAAPAVKITNAPIETVNVAADAADGAGTGEAAADGDQLPDDAKAPGLDDAGEMAAGGMDGDERDEEDDDIDMAGDLNGVAGGVSGASIDADPKLVQTGASAGGGNGGREPSVQRDPFVDDEESSFFSYFMFVLLVCVAVYVLYHNRRQLVALLLEGRRRNGASGVGRRKHTAAYRKLDTNLEEAISSSSTKTTGDGGGGRSAQPIIY